MKINKIIYTILLSANILFIILLLIFYILGQKERKAYLSDFYFNIDKTLKLNNIDIEQVKQILSLENGQISNETLSNYIYTNNNIKYYAYNYKVKYYNKIFKNSDIYGVYIDTNKILQENNFLKEIIQGENGSPFGNFVSDKIISSDKIDNVSYILKIKKYIFLILIPSLLIIFFIIFVHNIKNLYIKILYTFLLLIILFLSEKYLLEINIINYIGIIFLILVYYFLAYYEKINNFKNIYYIDIKKEYIILYVSAFLFSIINVLLLNYKFPLIGHDFSMIIPRAYSLLLYAQNNGIFNTEFASPLVGAGIISYANPQYDQYSLFYFIRYFLPFWNSYLLIIFIFSFIGFISFYYAAKDILKCSFSISLMSAILFSCTSYYMHHISVGHWAFLYHPLTAVIVWMSFTDRFNYFVRIVISGLSFSIMIFGGALQTIFFLTCFSLLGIAAILFKPNKKFILQCSSIIISTMLGIILSLSKFIPAIYFGSKIDRGPWGLYINDIRLLLSNILHILIYPFYNLINLKSFLTNSSMRIGISYIYTGETWEADLGLPVCIFIFGLFSVIYLLKNNISKESFINFFNKYKFNLIFIVIFLYLYCDIFFGDGLIRSTFKTLKAVNIHLRMNSTLIIPILFLFALLINKLNIKYSNKLFIILFITISSLLLYIQKFTYIKEHNHAYINININNDKEIFKNIKLNHNQYKVSYINNISEFQNLKDFLTTTNLNTSRLPYESIYGYHLETFEPKEEGSPYRIVNGKYNFTDPRNLIFFTNKNNQFDGFETNDKKTLDNFLSFKSTDWSIPKIFVISNYISIISHIIVFIFLMLYIVYSLTIKNKKNIIIHKKY